MPETPRRGADAKPKALSPEQKAEQAAEAKVENSRDVLISKCYTSYHIRTAHAGGLPQMGRGRLRSGGRQGILPWLKALGVTENLPHLEKCKSRHRCALHLDGCGRQRQAHTQRAWQGDRIFKDGSGNTGEDVAVVRQYRRSARQRD